MVRYACMWYVRHSSTNKSLRLERVLIEELGTFLRPHQLATSVVGLDAEIEGAVL